MAIRYTQSKKVSADDLAELFRRSGIRRPVDDKKRLKKMLANANIVIAAWIGKERLVGIARALTDFSYCCYLSDLAVDKDYQKQGIGKELVRRLREKVGDNVLIVLLSAPTANSYYPSIGFEKATRAWKIPRKAST